MGWTWEVLGDDELDDAEIETLDSTYFQCVNMHAGQIALTGHCGHGAIQEGTAVVMIGEVAVGLVIRPNDDGGPSLIFATRRTWQRR